VLPSHILVAKEQSWKMNVLNWFSLEISLIVCLWAGLIMYYVVCKGSDNPKSLWVIPAVYAMFFTVPSALYNIGLGAATLLIGMACVMKWSFTDAKA
jgi:hypothetical protein